MRVCVCVVAAPDCSLFRGLPPCCLLTTPVFQLSLLELKPKQSFVGNPDLDFGELSFSVSGLLVSVFTFCGLSVRLSSVGRAVKMRDLESVTSVLNIRVRNLYVYLRVYDCRYIRTYVCACMVTYMHLCKQRTTRDTRFPFMMMMMMIIISFMQVIYTYILETNLISREHSVAAIL